VIGVISRGNEAQIVHEFFQLFKTPWEFYTSGKKYDVVISTVDNTPAVMTKLLIIYNSNETNDDLVRGIIPLSKHRNVCLENGGLSVPIYGNALSFKGTSRPLLTIKNSTAVSAIEIDGSHETILRIGYDLFQEVGFLLCKGQPIENAYIPTLDMHIMILREWIINCGIRLIEIPAVPAGYDFMVCLTHDVDFVKIRHHRFDHTMWGFLYRSTFGSFFDLLMGKISLSRFLRNWKAVLLLPFVHLGLAQDFWLNFEKYLAVEKGLSSTFFFIPFKNRSGDKVPMPNPERRATRYDIRDVRDWARVLLEKGYEIGVHGIDGWHNSKKGREEFHQIAEITGVRKLGVRMHWLCFDSNSPKSIEDAGYSYDSTCGYNNTVGYLNGTLQVYRPIGTLQLLEIPMHIQDSALFNPAYLGWTENQAWSLCNTLIKNASIYGGVLTILWHHRSLAPERLWGDFYVRLLGELKAHRTWFGTAMQVVEWFQKRREISFKAVSRTDDLLRLTLECEDNDRGSELVFRVHIPQSSENTSHSDKHTYIDVPWNGQDQIEIPLR